MSKFPEEELEQMATQIYGELVFSLGDAEEAKKALDYKLSNWDPIDFAVAFPGRDHKKAFAAFQYLSDNWNRLKKEVTGVTIDMHDLERFGLTEKNPYHYL